MRVSSAAVQQQSRIIAALGSAAAAAIAARLRETGELEAVPGIAIDVARAYSTMSAAVSATYYNRIRQASKVRSRYSAEALSGFDASRTAAAAQAIANEVVDGAATVSLAKLLGDLMGREVKNAADNCIRANARRDPAKPKYAIVPNGDACAFCQMRASLGYTYPDEDAVESHDHCTCTPTPVFGNSTVQGFDVDAYRGRWDDAATAYKDKDYSEDMQHRIDAAKERHDRLYAEGKTNKKWDDSNAVLMIMREQQGIS